MSAAATPIVRPKEFHFPLRIEWQGGRRVAAGVDGKQSIAIAPPPVFHGGEDPATWSPEDFFVAAAASCLAVTFTGLAARAGLEYSSLSVEADGVCSLRSDRRFGFTRLLLRLELETDAAQESRRGSWPSRLRRRALSLPRSTLRSRWSSRCTTPSPPLPAKTQPEPDAVEASLHDLRRTEFGRLDAGGHVYLDYTGAGLYAESQLTEHMELLQGTVFGNRTRSTRARQP